MKSFRQRMQKKKAGLKKRHNQKLKTGGKWPTIFKKSKIPDGVNFFKCKEGLHKVDILPFQAGKNMPFDENDKPITPKGEFDYVINLYVHQQIGSKKEPFVCPYENFGKSCPICEYLGKGRLPKKQWNKIRAKRRSIYLLWDRTNREEEKKGIQIFDAAHFFMEEKIKEIAEAPEEGGYITFSDIGNKKDPGVSVAWKRKGSGQENTNYLGHRFINRKTKLPDRILEEIFPLDMVIKMHPKYDEIKKAFESTQRPKHEEEDEDLPFDEDEEDIDESGWEKVKKKKKKSKKDKKSSSKKKKKKKSKG